MRPWRTVASRLLVVKPVIDAVIVPLQAQTLPGILNPLTLASNRLRFVRETEARAAPRGDMTVDASLGTLAVPSPASFRHLGHEAGALDPTAAAPQKVPVTERAKLARG
jgi:hypothetical protein